jgi:predicted RecB family nuclease
MAAGRVAPTSSDAYPSRQSWAPGRTRCWIRSWRGVPDPEYVHQLSIYSKLVGLVQGREPDVAHLLLGDGTTLAIELRRYAALHRYVVARLERIVDAPACETYPEPVSHCDICPLAVECDARRRADDHLSLVAGARRDHREHFLVEIGLGTVRALAEAPESTDARPLRAERFQLLRRQAALQVESRDTQLPVHRQLQPPRATGYALLPPPSAGDMFFDLEGDPMSERASNTYGGGAVRAAGTTVRGLTMQMGRRARLSGS